jgi:ABC-2 type transport system ATP-binding protein
MTTLRIDNLSKHYGRIKAVDQLSLEVHPGEVFGLLGPNGSGKTTTLGIILGIIKANSGQFEWFEGNYGINPRKRLGALLETPNFYPYLNALDNLDIIARIKQVESPRFQEVLELVNLWKRRKSPFKTYSLGMKQRLAIAAAMIGDPEVLIFDEPTNGLDPQGIAEVRETLLGIAQTGKTIIMASHILDEVEKICSHVAIIKNGSMLATGTVGAIISSDQTIEIQAENMDALYALLQQVPGIKQIDLQNQVYILSAEDSLKPEQLNQLAFDRGLVLSRLLTRQQSLESEFLEITKDKAPV